MKCAHDEWIIGEGFESPGRWYVEHTIHPRFRVEIFDADADAPVEGDFWPLPDRQVAGNLTELEPQSASDYVLDGSNVLVYLGKPMNEKYATWMEEIGVVLVDYDTRADRRREREQREEA